MRLRNAFAAAALAAFAAAPAARAGGCPAGASVCYTYDSYGRIITVTYANGTTLTYTYDNTDNTVTKTVTCSANGC